MASDSNADNYVYDWVTLRDFTNGKFTADYKERDPNAIAAANLVTKRGEPSGPPRRHLIRKISRAGPRAATRPEKPLPGHRASRRD